MTTEQAGLAGIDCERVELAGGRAVLWRGDCLEQIEQRHFDTAGRRIEALGL